MSSLNPDRGDPLVDGCTPGWVELSHTSSGVYVLSLKGAANPENRWTWEFCLAVLKAFEAIERHLERHPDSPAALLTISESPKFFSNGIDPDGKYSKTVGLPSGSKVEETACLALMMAAFIRPLQLPIPTVAAVGGHAFGAGMMFAVGHDYRLQAEGRGFMCAVEIEIGVGIPPPEMELFSHVLPKPHFYHTVMGAKRWAAQESLNAGLIVKSSSHEDLFKDAYAFAQSQAKLAAGGRRRKLFMRIKDQAKGQVQRMVMEYTFPNNDFPEELSNVPGVVQYVRDRFPYLLKHIGETVEDVPIIPPPPTGTTDSKL